MQTIPEFWAQHADELATARSASLPALVRHILERYHRPGMADLARLETLVVEAALEDAGRYPVLKEVRDEVFRFALLLRAHFQKEELEVFPPLLAEACGEVPFTGLDRVTLLEEEHAAVEGLLVRLRQLTEGFGVPAEAGPRHRDLMDALGAFAESLARHLWLEHHLLFSRVPASGY